MENRIAQTKDPRLNPKKIEYYQHQHPDWTYQQCQSARSLYYKQRNLFCIEYWQLKYPNLSLEEQQNLMSQYKKDIRKTTWKQCIEYWQFHYPELSPQEQIDKMQLYRKQHAKQCIEYWQFHYPELSPQEHQQQLNQYIGDLVHKTPHHKGIDNPSHKSKIDISERKRRSPNCIEFYECKFPNETHEQHIQRLEKHRQLLAKKFDIKKSACTVEYWVDKGYSEMEAKIIIREKYGFTLQKCILKYGLEKGIEIYQDRQKRWQKSLHKNFELNGVDGTAQSSVAKQFIHHLCQMLNIPIPKKEHYMTDSMRHRSYAYDFIYGNKIIEFNGDYWHANPKIYNADFYNKVKCKTATEIWQYDKEKIQFAQQHGYQVLVVWENEFSKNPEYIYQQCLEFLTK